MEPPRNLSARIPTTDYRKIVGREKDLDSLQQLLTLQNKLVVVNGPGGIGKTTLAQAYIDQYGREYAHLLWVTQSDGDGFVLDLVTTEGLKENLGIRAEGKDINTVFQEILAALNSMEAKPCLWVIDNANASLHRYFDYLPKPPHWHILATSREKIEHFTAKELDFLSEADGVLLFQAHCSRITDEAAIRSVLSAVDYHTLTVEILAKTAQRFDTPLQVLQQAIENDLKTGVYIRHKGDKIERVTSYLLSIFEINALSEQEQQLLQQFAALPGEYIPYEMLQSLLSAGEDGIAPTLQDLVDKGWLLAQQQPEAYKMHRIIQAVVRQKLPPTVEALQHLIDRVSDLLAIDQTKDNPVDKFPFIPFGETLESLFRESSDTHVSRLQNNLALVLKFLGAYQHARVLLEKALRSDEKNFGEKHPDTAVRYSNLAVVLQDLRELHEARVLLEKAVRSYEENFGEKHPATAVSYSNLALVLKGLGELQEARVLLEKALHSAEENFGEKHPSTAVSYSNLALVLKDLGELQKARVLLEKALRSCEENFGEKHPATAVSYSNLAAVLQDLGELQKARVLLEKALRSDEENFGEKHPDTAVSYSNLALVLRALGELQKTRVLLEKALRSNEENFGEKHPATAVTYSNLALVLQDLGELQLAFILLFKAYQVLSGHFEEKHPYHQRVIDNLNSLMNHMLQNGWTEKALQDLIKQHPLG